MLNIIGSIICVLLEALYLFICIKTIKGRLTIVKNIGLFIGIIITNLASGILHTSVFRYLLVLLLWFVVLRIIYQNRVRFYDVFALNCILAIKLTIEFIFVVILSFSIMEVNVITALIGGAIITLFAILSRTIFYKLYQLLIKLWDDGEAFYLRYILSILLISATMLYFQAMLKHIEKVV